MSKKKPVKKTDPSDLQAPIDVAPETAMQAPPPEFASPLDMQWKSPNGDPFDNLYRRQRKT